MTLLKRNQLHEYQEFGVDFIKEKGSCGLFMDMGLGKTVTSLTAAADFLDDFRICRVLVIAPLRVANTVWHKEVENWEHLNHLKVNICTGSAQKRLEYLDAEADIYTINRENVPWLVEMYGKKKRGSKRWWKWDMVVIDESSSFKAHDSKRSKALRKKVVKLDLVDIMVLLTGTPSPNGITDLWSQMYLIDKGERLGTHITHFRKRYMQRSYSGFGYDPLEGSMERVSDAISDVVVSMETEDYLKDLPERIDVVRSVELPAKHRKEYKQLEDEFVLQIDTADINVVNAAAKANKCLQFCNGAVYDEDREVHWVHDQKIKELQQIREDNPDENMLVAYNYKPDRDRILKAFPEAVLLDKKGEALDRWNNGDIKMLVAHPASAGHGINAQHGGAMVVWFGLNWSLELYQQFNKRLHRQGQKDTVRIVHLVVEGCIDEKVLYVLTQEKAKTQKELIMGLKRKLKA
jgi:SNF2 family DNA or RNA helicase